MRRRPLTPEQLASIRRDIERGKRDLEAFARGEGPAPGFREMCGMSTDPPRSHPGSMLKAPSLEDVRRAIVALPPERTKRVLHVAQDLLDAIRALPARAASGGAFVGALDFCYGVTVLLDEKLAPGAWRFELPEETARHLVTCAVTAFFDEKGLPSDVNERTVTHRLALHLEREVRFLPASAIGGAGVDPTEFYVDCEYNRRDLVTKELKVLAEAIEEDRPKGDWSRDTRARTVYPDIIVHKRGDKGPNLIVIEVKRLGGRHRRARKAIRWDLGKLRCYKRELQYQHAFLLLLGKSHARLCRIPEKVDRTS